MHSSVRRRSHRFTLPVPASAVDPEEIKALYSQFLSLKAAEVGEDLYITNV
jgi:hypothetical protein